MPTLELAGGRLQVSYPDSYQEPPERPGSTRARRGSRGAAASKEPTRPADKVSAALLGAFAAQGLELVAPFELVPKAPTGHSGRPVPARRGKIKVALDLTEGQSAVVLLEQDGFFSWHLPKGHVGVPRTPLRGAGLAPAAAPGQAAQHLGGPPSRVVRFEFDVRPVAPSRPQARTQTHSALGPFGDAVVGGFTASVLTFASQVVPGAVLSFLERDIHPGLVRISGDNVKTWPLVDNLTQVPLPEDRPARILLLVHGTFSTTVGSYGMLTATAEGQKFLEAAAGSYDAVIGFDHRTLSRDPLENAIDLHSRLRARRLAFTPAIDIISYSRGGLIARSLIEYLLPSSAWRADIGKVVFVGATNAGTPLAEPENWKNLIDLYTNLAAATTRSIAASAGAAQSAEILEGLLNGVGTLVKYQVLVPAARWLVPGLAAMDPDGPFITAINGTQPGQPVAGTPWHVISSNFEAELLDDQPEPAALPGELMLKLADGLADRVMGAPNDLVVDTASMSSVDLPSGGGFIKETLAFGTNGVVHHLNYFIQPGACDALRNWLT